VVNQISISVATMKDARALVALRTSVAEDMTRKFGEGHWSARPTRADVVRQLRASQVLVARAGEELVGTVRLVRVLPGVVDSSAFTPVEKSCYVLGLAVAPERRQAGIGRQLMDAAKQMARSRGVQALWLDAYQHEAGAGPFYIKCGFRRVGRTEFRDTPLEYFEWLATGPPADPSQPPTHA
jgi:GNAT superfamily N-acetyltransferase